MTTVHEQRPTTGPEPSSSPRPQKPERRRRHRGWWIAAWVVVALVLLVHLGGGWYFAGRIYSQALASNPATGTPVYDDVEVVRLAGNTITLRKGPDVAANFDAPGKYGLAWQGGTGFVDKDVKVNPDGTVTRSFRVRAGSAPGAGQLAAVERSYWFTPDFVPNSELSTRDADWVPPVFFERQDVTIAGMPAWLYHAGSATKDTLTIFVHGRNGTRLDGLRFVSSAIGSSDVLVITYRNDVGAPKDESGRLQYGQTEWRDLEAAVQWAQAQGIKNLVLAGQSMGGAVVSAFMENSPRRTAVRGVILDAPMLSLHEMVANGAKTALPGGVGVPPTVIWAAERIASLRYGVDWAAVDYLDNADWVTVPTLIIHGVADPEVPISVSRQLKQEKPTLVQLEEFPGALHVESWNFDSQRYGNLVGPFVQKVRG